MDDSPLSLSSTTTTTTIIKYQQSCCGLAWSSEDVWFVVLKWNPLSPNGRWTVSPCCLGTDAPVPTSPRPTSTTEAGRAERKQRKTEEAEQQDNFTK